MNVADAAYAVVHDYPGGTESLAPRLGMSGAVLRNKVNPHCDTHRLALDEAVRITDITGDDRMLRAWAAHRGQALASLNVGDADGAVMGYVLEVHAHEGELSRVLASALADGVISQNEMRAIDAAALDVQGALLGLVNRLMAAHRAREHA